MSLFGEALRAGLQPCSYSLLILALVVMGMRGGQSRLPALAVFYVAATMFAWIPFVDVNPLLDNRLTGTVGLFAGLALVAWPTKRARSTGLSGAALVGAFAGATWLPCVGRELGTILTAATKNPWPGLAGLTLYLFGVLWIALLAAVVADFVPSARRVLDRPATIMTFGLLGGGLTLAVALDLYPLVLSRLARLSSL